MVRLGSMTFAAAFAAIATVGAHAADMDFPNAPPNLTPEAPVELGTGWYLRGDAGFAREQLPQLSVNATPIPTGAQLLNSGGSKNGWSAGLGFGYKFNSWLRTDFTYEVRNGVKVDSTSADFDCPYSVAGLTDQITNLTIGLHVINNKCRAGQKASLSRQVGMANFYIDLGNWSGVTPYIGAGVGIAYGATQGTYNWYNSADGSPYNVNLVLPSGYPFIYVDAYGNKLNPQPVINYGPQSRYQVSNTQTYQLAWSLMGGFSYDISSHMKLDINYRYLQMGAWKTPTASTIAKSSDVRVGIRYMID
ncbi:MAG: porin family protein [Hyphomicrobiales bacterium]|nr:porin family protein [Hyphomicrobiales bacterium]